MNGDGSSAIQTQWKKISGLLRAEIGEAAYRSWLKPMSVRTERNGLVTLAVPTRFMRDWVIAHYCDRMRTLWGSENPQIRGIDIIVMPGECQSFSGLRDSAAATLEFAPCASQSAVAGSHSGALATLDTKSVVRPLNGVNGSNGQHRPLLTDDGQELGSPLDPRYTFDRFVVGKPNEFAYAAARRVSESEKVSFNPLFLYGGVGLGKTHLMHAMAWHIRAQQPRRSVLYLSAEKFMYRFIRALREQRTVNFKEQFRSVDVLMIDDVQFISGKESTQEEFFHTFNALVDQGRQIVLTADRSPSDLEGIQDRLKSRLNCGVVADIHATTYELRLGILEAKAEQAGASIPRKVMEFLAHRITSNVRELEGALNRVIAHAQLIGLEITLDTAQDVLHDLLRANDRRISIDEIQKQVAAHYKIRLAEMSSARRSRAVARPRQVAMYLSKQLTSRSLPEIGRKFGNRDHTTVMHAVKKVEELKAQDAAFAEDVELLKRMLES